MQRHLGWASLAISLAVALVLGLTRLGSRLVRLSRARGGSRRCSARWRILLVGDLATLPFDLARRSNALEYGLTNQSLGGWSRDWVTSLLVSWVFAGDHRARRAGLARRSPRRWPLWAGLAGAVLAVLGSWVYPVVVEPLFNHFTSLPQGELRTKILALAEKEKVPVSDVLVADASRRTTTLNAYVSGFGSTRRVVLYDNLVDDVPERETLTVVAHELGHARHHDVATGTLLGAAACSSAAGCSGWCCPGGGCSTGPGAPTPVSRRWWRCCWPWPRWGRCWRARSRTRSAGRWRRAPTGPRSRRPATTAGSSGCRCSSPRGRSATTTRPG